MIIHKNLFGKENQNFKEKFGGEIYSPYLCILQFKKTVMETKELRKVKRELKQIGDKINATANRVNKGLVTEFGDGSKWIEFNHFLFDGSQVIYKLDEYEEYLLDTDKDIKNVTTLSYKEFHDLRRSVGITKEYCVEPKK